MHEDENQDVYYEATPAALREARIEAGCDLIEAMPATTLYDLQPTNGLTTDPRYGGERRRAIRRFVRRLVDRMDQVR